MRRPTDDQLLLRIFFLNISSISFNEKTQIFFITDTEKRNGGTNLLSVPEHLYTKVACQEIEEENEQNSRR